MNILHHSRALGLGFLLLTAWSPAQIQVTHLTIETKKNGALLRLRTSQAVDLQNVTGWISSNNYFYITILNAGADTSQLGILTLPQAIRSVEIDQVRESVQFAFQMRQPLESFEFYQSSNPPEIMVSLRFPVAEVLAALQQEQAAVRRRSLIESDHPVRSLARSRYDKIRAALYIMGGSLTVAGIITQDNQEGYSREFIAGLTIVAGTALYDRVIRPRLIHD